MRLRDKRLVVIRPRLEEWLLAKAAAAGVQPATYQMPEDSDALHKKWHYERHPRFGAFVDALLSADPELQRLKAWLA